ncbi:hypothetical protein HDU98_008938 [Podochytrium sp. JEL0797]|nr:hypothetical protein HDU98_008938 [Podochytrium sp. JEL0797]
MTIPPPPPSHTLLLASLESIRIDLFTNTDQKPPAEFMNQITALVSSFSTEELAVPSHLSPRIQQLLAVLRAKLEVDLECLKTLKRVGKPFDQVKELYCWMLETGRWCPEEEERMGISERTDMHVDEVKLWFECHRRNVSTNLAASALLNLSKS